VELDEGIDAGYPVGADEAGVPLVFAVAQKLGEL